MAGSLSRPVAGLLLDMDDVLVDATVWRRWLLQLLSRLGVQAQYTCLFRVWDREFLRDVHRGRRPFCEAFESFLLALGLRRAQIEEITSSCQARRRHLEATARPLPGVKSTLTRLHQAGLVLGVLNNSESPGAALQGQLDRFGLEGLFAAVLSSIDLERTKPDPVTYLTALRAMRLAPEQAAFVGHDTAELAGAAEVGMRTVAFNFDRDARADVYLGRFEELLEVVGVRTRYAAAG